ncbi:ATP-dependent DNA helicase [Trichonephila clavipes]|nr:ATP-dependent DNA helicase [Trichonephila clavipes]
MHQANQQLSSILTKIRNGEQLDEIEIILIESRFCTVEEVELRYPQDYSTLTIPSMEQETFVRQKLHKMSLIDTNGLPYQTVYVNDIYYMITTNIDVADGLANGAVGNLVHVETNVEGLVKTVRLEFPVLPQIRGKLRRKKAILPYFYKITE